MTAFWSVFAALVSFWVLAGVGVELARDYLFEE
jgi:hypothetical protein